MVRSRVLKTSIPITGYPLVLNPPTIIIFREKDIYIFKFNAIRRRVMWQFKNHASIILLRSFF